MEIKNKKIKVRGEAGMISFYRLKVLIFLLVLNLPYFVYGKDALLVIRQDGKDFQDALKGISDELRNDFDIFDKIITKKTEIAEIKKEIDLRQPQIIVLMDNSTIALFKKYQNSLPDSVPRIPSISLMGVLVQGAIEGLENATGISYEIPIVTSVVSLRAVLKISMKKIGVIHRQFLDDFMSHNRQFCKKEGIEIVNISLPNKSDNYKSALKDGLKNLIESKKVDVLWVPNDNAFLQPEIMKDIWIPTLKKYKIPIIVGVEVLVKPQLNFGTFAVLPDHISLGSQAAEMVYDIMDNDWNTNGRKVEPPLAVYKIINFPQVKSNFDINDDLLKSIDKIVK
jgi:ABC-type uncharacterized transport system substrate-binding protein